MKEKVKTNFKIKHFRFRVLPSKALGSLVIAGYLSENLHYIYKTCYISRLDILALERES